MPGILVWPSREAEAGLLALAVAALALAAIAAYRAWRNSRVSAEERERRRRALLVSRGNTGDAVLVEVREDLLFFTYDVRGVEYTASQDISSLKDQVPQDLSSIDSVAVRYLPENPANSIILAEAWTGLRLGKIAR